MMNDKSSSTGMLNVLMVSIAAPPYRTAESLQFSKYLKFLSSSNLNLSLVTSAQKSNKGWRRTDSNYHSTLDLFNQIIKIPSSFPRTGEWLIRQLVPNFFERPDHRRLFIKGWKRVIQELETRPDILYSRSTPLSSTVMTMKLQKHYQVPWILHLSDPWTLSPVIKRSGSMLDYHNNLEYNSFSQASKICLTSPEQISLYAKKYPEFSSKFEWFPNVFDDELLWDNETEFNKPMLFVHTGNFYGKERSPAPLLKALQQVAEEAPEVIAGSQFHFAGSQEEGITQLMENHQHLGVKYLGPLSLKETVELQRKATVLVAVDLDLPAEESIFFPSKILDYMAAGKPVLAITKAGSTVYHAVHQNLGRCYNHQDTDGIKSYIIDMHRKFRNRHEYFAKPYQADHRYAASYNAGRLIDLLETTAASAG